MILQASIPSVAPNGILAALVLEIDTIPKPDGLGLSTQPEHVERQSVDFESDSRGIEGCSTSFECLTHAIHQVMWISRFI
jgi:hypothetical protein